MTTQKQDVVKAKREIDTLKENHRLIGLRVAAAISNDTVNTQDLLDLQSSGNKYFNYVEGCCW